jgi:glycosyltransferase involved in cell wall biosynthesis
VSRPNREAHVILVDTNSPDLEGSMSRYARLVEASLSNLTTQNTGLKISRICLAVPFALPKYLPVKYHPWVNHFWILTVGRYRLSRCHADLFHALDGSYAYALTKSLQKKALVTMHDLIPMIQSAGLSDEKRTSIFADKIISASHRVLSRCRHLIAVSRSTRSDAVNLLKIEPDKISVIHLALDPLIKNSGSEKESKTYQTATSETPVILHVGNNAWYKNRAAVIRIFACVRCEVPSKLILVGPPADRELQHLIQSLGIGKDVRFESNLGNAELLDQYSKASLLLFPSLYEGFGWPPLEAMACGCPVVTSSAASLPEVVGDAGLMADVGDEDLLTKLCIDVLTDPGLAVELSRKGIERAKKFSTQEMGEQILAIYQKLLNLEQQTNSAPVPNAGLTAKNPQ